MRSRRKQKLRNQNLMNEQKASPPNWLNLPQDIITMILQKVGVLNILLSAQLVCTQWRKICTDPSMWTTIRVGVDWLSYQTPRTYKYRTYVENMIRWAVDQSCGSLFDIDLDRLISKQLLYYVVKRCNRIRRLRVDQSMCCLEDVLEIVTTRLALLEDFELVGYAKLSSGIIETLGRYCPKLTSLKIYVHGDEEAKTLARSMPQLRHICFSGKSFVTDVGVEALLDGCPHLESLDIRECYFFEITGAFQMTKKLPLTRTQWREVLEKPSTCRTIRVFNNSLHNCEEFKCMIRRAVDNSCGGLVDLELGEYMSGDILDYVVERCTGLKRLHGFMSSDCSEEAVRAALARLPLLEDLSLGNYQRCFSAATVETLMRCCPGLTSLKIRIDDNGAKTLSLPRLRHLKLCYTYKLLTNVGVEALLDGCGHLESLDLQECRYIAPKNDIFWIRCAQKVKYIRRPRQLNYIYYCRSVCGSKEDDSDSNQFLEEDVCDYRRGSRREVKKEFVHWNQIKKILLE